MGMMENKIVFITGGDKGIGKAIVCRFAELYKTVIFTYNKNVEGAKEVGEAFSNVFFYQCDLANAGQCENLAKDIIRTYGKVDILINNAGYDNDSTFLKMEKDQWDTVIDINLRSIYYFTQSFSRIMSECKWGRIINLLRGLPAHLENRIMQQQKLEWSGLQNLWQWSWVKKE